MKDTNSTPLRFTLVNAMEWTGPMDGKSYRREEWTITGGEIDPAWCRGGNTSEPSSRFTLWIVDGEVDPRLSSYGGAVWPPAWSKLFEVRGHGYQRGVAITDEGLMCRAAALYGASDMYADVRLS